MDNLGSKSFFSIVTMSALTCVELEDITKENCEGDGSWISLLCECALVSPWLCGWTRGGSHGWDVTLGGTTHFVTGLRERCDSSITKCFGVKEGKTLCRP